MQLCALNQLATRSRSLCLHSESLEGQRGPRWGVVCPGRQEAGSGRSATHAGWGPQPNNLALEAQATPTGAGPPAQASALLFCSLLVVPTGFQQNSQPTHGCRCPPAKHRSLRLLVADFTALTQVRLLLLQSSLQPVAACFMAVDSLAVASGGHSPRAQNDSCLAAAAPLSTFQSNGAKPKLSKFPSHHCHCHSIWGPHPLQGRAALLAGPRLAGHPVVVILQQVHLQQPCYDFCFL